MSMTLLIVERAKWAYSEKTAHAAPPSLIIERGLAYIDAPGTALQVRVGDLSIRLAGGSRHLFQPGEHKLRTIVLGGRGNSITTNALAWLLAEHVELLISENAEQFIALFASSPLADASRAALKLRVRQFEAMLDPRRSTVIAREIVARKIAAERHSRIIRAEFLAALRAARTTDDIRHIEAGSAQIWWRQWADAEMRFAGAGVPAKWRSWPGRYIGRRQGKLGELAAQFTARNATHPLQALHNYAITVLVSRITRVVIARGCDPCFGFLHDGRKPGRLSLCWDFVEVWRPCLVRAVFEYAAARKFSKDDFAAFEKGIVRLSAPVAREVAVLSIKTVSVREMVRGVDEIVRLF